MAEQAPVAANSVQPEGQPYTFKSGDFRLVVSPTLNLSWNDNVFLTHSNREDDFIIQPAMGFNATYPLTDRNLLNLNLTAGYTFYCNHPDLDSFYLGSGSQLSLDVFVKDFHFNFHDSFSYTENGSAQPAVSDTGAYGTFQNTSGVLGTWDYGDVTATLSYDHQITEATSSQFAQTDASSELFASSLGLKVYPHVTLGGEATGTIMVYQQQALNNNNGWSVGVYGEWTPDAYFSVKPRVGYTVSYFQQTSQLVPASDQDSWYADLTITHQPTRVLTYSLSAGHELQSGVESDALEDYYARANLTWNIMKNVSIGTPISYEYGSQKGGQLSTAYGENFSYYNAGLNVSWSPMTRLTTSLSYQLTVRASDISTGEYAQNVIGLNLAYALP